ncbi:hypothetical protein HMPREF9999_02016 [Alloprevotella sp. oral taxon 473 str. F0040]|nr:hypothetical protein HMPREF9999_02016 [Alloprevotella sp. oral taxon 473 str. F0040]
MRSNQERVWFAYRKYSKIFRYEVKKACNTWCFAVKIVSLLI